MNRVASYGIIAFIFQISFSGNLLAEPVAARVVFEDSKFDGVGLELGLLKFEKEDLRIQEAKAALKTENKTKQKMSELDSQLKNFRIMSVSA